MWQKPNRIDLQDLTDIPEPKFVEIGGMKVAYRVYGHGRQVLCLPPWPASSIAYLPLGMALADEVQLVAVDLPGWGGHSDKMIWKPTLMNYARILEEFIDKAKLEHPDLMGYSFGGALAQQMIAAKKVAPKKLILVSTIHSGDEILGEAKRWFKLYSAVESTFVAPYICKKILFGMMARNIDKGPYHPLRYTILGKITEQEYLFADMHNVIDSLEDLTNKEFINYFKPSTETLVIYAENDMPFIQNETREIAHKLNVEPVVIADANHDHLFFDVNKSSEIILNFLLS